MREVILQDTFTQIDNDQAMSQERRPVYMAMTRSRDYLYLCYEGSLSEPIRTILTVEDRVH